MKKLTKTLSLVLVVAMVLSLCVIGVGASYKDFTDKGTITKDYTEAAEIMTDLGCVAGMTATTYAPTGTFTRAQAAVIITRMVMGTATDTLAPTTVTFTDVPADYWGYKYIECAASLGYVAGTGDNKYSPEDTLTGYEWAAMLLKVRGATTVSNSDWQIATAQTYYATKTAFSAVAISGANITREAAVQMAYDAMFKSLSGATGYPVIDDSGNVVGVYSTVAEAAAMMNALNTAHAAGEPFTVGTTPVTMGTDYLAKTVYGVTKGVNTDSFGRPSNSYKADTTAEATTYGWNPVTLTKLVKNVPVLTYTTPVKSGKLYSDLNGFAGTIDTVVNSASAQATGTYTAVAGGATAVDNTGYGILTEVYKTSSTPTYTMVQIVPSFAAVTVTTHSATTTRGAYTTYAVAGMTGNVFTTVVDKTLDVSTAVVTGTVANGDSVLAYQDGDGTVYIFAVSKLSGVLSAISNTGVLTIDSNAKQISNAAGASASTAYTIKTTSQDFYTDSYGYVLGSANAATTANYCIVLNHYTGYITSNNVLVPVTMANLVMPDGTVANVPVAAVAADDTAYTYTVSTKGVYTLTAMSDTLVDGTAGNVRTNTAGSAITTGKTSVTNGATVNDNTVFVFANYDSTGAKDGTVTTYTGKNNVPTTTATCVSIDTTKTADTIADVVYVGSNVKSAASGTFVYVVGTYNQTSSGYVYDTIVNGKASTITVSYNGLSSKTLYTKIVDNGSGLTTALDSSVKASATAPAKMYTSVKYNGGILLLTNSASPAVSSTYACGADVPVYTFASDGTCTTTTASALTTAVTTMHAVFSYASDTTTITGIYFF